MDLNSIVLSVAGFIASIIGFYVKELYGRVKALEKDMADHRVEDVEKYVQHRDLMVLKNDIKEILAPLASKMENIENHLRERRHDDR
jgi:hypothetical protein